MTDSLDWGASILIAFVLLFCMFKLIEKAKGIK